MPAIGLLLLFGFKLAAVITSGVGIICFIYFVKRQSRIRFGAANLKVSVVCSVAVLAPVRVPANHLNLMIFRTRLVW